MNYLADVIRSNPAGLTQKKLTQIMKPRGIILAAINLNIYPQVKDHLKDSEAHHNNEPWGRQKGKP